MDTLKIKNIFSNHARLWYTTAIVLIILLFIILPAFFYITQCKVGSEKPAVQSIISNVEPPTFGQYVADPTKDIVPDVELPTFHQYAINLGDSYDGKIAEVDLNSHPKAEMFKTALREGVKNGPNFAFYYTVVTWGCGTECQSFTIVDVRDGKVYFPDVGSRWGIDFEEDGKLLITNPVKNIYETGGQDLDMSSEYYVWEDNQLTLIKAAKVRYTIVQ